MKKISNNPEMPWPSDEYIEQLREKLRKRIEREELESALRLEALDRLVGVLQVEPMSFQQLWIDPLVEAGLTMDVAIACIIASYFQPN